MNGEDKQAKEHKKPDTRTVAQRQRSIRQEELREWLSKQGLVQHVANLAAKIGDVDIDIDDKMLARYKIAIDTNLRLAAKYCPDLKSTEIIGDRDNPIALKIISEFLDE